MDLGVVTLHLLVVIVAARIAAEVAERLHQPAVLAEILAGILVGPSVLGVVRDDEFLRTLGELGAILLLFEVGMQMDVAELARVGADSLRVALIGVAAPMAAGYVVLRALGLDGSVAVFLAAGITATSVGITARVFGDLRALATSEARIVLGAAVADDVAGLLVLTVVVRFVAEGSFDLASLAGIVGIAVGFVVGAAVIGVLAVPRVFGELARRARTDGTLMAIAFAVALGLARLASAAKLAPIVGAFVAGLAFSRSASRDEVQRRLVPVGHLLIPIFFVQIGLDTRLSVFTSRSVLGIAAALSVVAILGKLAAGAGVGGGRASRLLVGVGMIPRGEVGLIFAGFGLTHAILDERNYGILVLVVLVTTVVAPPALRVLVERTRRAVVATRTAVIEPPGGWLRVDDDEVELAAEPPLPALAARVGLDAAVACASRRPGPRLLEWLAGVQVEAPVWDEDTVPRFFRLLRHGSVRSWRFLELTGVLARIAPELEAAIHRRSRDPFDLDPSSALRWTTLEDMRALADDGDPAAVVWDRVVDQPIVLLAALARNAFDADRDPPAATERLALALALAPERVEEARFLVTERHSFPAAASRLDMGTEEAVLELASHIGSSARADALYVLAVAEGGMEPWRRERLDEMFGLVQSVLAHPELTGASATDLVDQRRRAAIEALRSLPEEEVRRHLEAAPRRYLLAQGPEAIARHLQMVRTRPVRGEVRLHADPGERAGDWTLHVAVLDRPGVLACIAGALASAGVSVEDASISTWRDGIALDVFRVRAPQGIDWGELPAAMAECMSKGLPQEERTGVDGEVEIDNLASPWYTIVNVRTRDRAGLLHRVASALAGCGVSIESATVNTIGEIAVDSFSVVGPHGGKLEAGEEARLLEALAGTSRRRWPVLRVRRGHAKRP